jgi:hypothetical protein
VSFSRSLRLLWLAALGLLIAVVLFPVSNRLTRGASLALLCVVWFGGIVLCWRFRWLRNSLIASTLIGLVFISLPARDLPPSESLRTDYVAALRRFEGTQYVWGGESRRGIDCSGLVRCGLMEATFRRGIHNLDPGLVRYALSLWWNDCTAKVLGEGNGGATADILDIPSINQLDHGKVLPGDLAVTANGIHIMAYLGDEKWIEADPSIMRVIQVSVPSADNAWFSTPMKIVRWRLLSH